MTTQKGLIDTLLAKQGNTFTTEQAVAAGVDRNSLTYWTRKGKLERVKNGLYTSDDAFEDPFFAIQSRIPQAIFSGHTALYLFGYTTETPSDYEITMPRGYHLRSWKNVYDIKVRSKDKFHLNSNVINAKTPAGNYVKVYSPEQSVVDIWTNPRESPQRQFEALAGYRRAYGENFLKLFQVMNGSRSTQRLFQALEVLTNE